MFAKNWVLNLIFLTIYGLTIFGLTRSYYMESAPAPASLAKVSPQPTSELSNSMNRFNLATGNLLSEISKSGSELTRLADSYFQQKNYSKAAELYTRLLKLEPNNVEAHNDLGLSLYYIGQAEDAIAALKEGVANDSRYQRIWLTLGFIQANTGKTEEALIAFAKAIEIDATSGVGKEAVKMRERLLASRR